MTTAGPNAPGTMAQDTSYGSAVTPWLSVDNAKLDNGAYAVSGGYSLSFPSYYLKATNFGFSIPSGATINGITVTINRKASKNDSNYARDESLRLVKGGTISGNNKASATHWPTSDTDAVYGGISDLWGLALSDSDVNASNFGVVLSANYYNPGKGTVTGYVDFISITVTYTTGGGGASAVPVIMNQYRQRIN